MVLVLVAVCAVAFFVIFLLIYASRFVRVGPNQLLVVSGRKCIVAGSDGQQRTVGYRLVSGGGTFVFPVIEKADMLSLEAIPLDSKGFSAQTSGGQSAVVDAAAEVKIGGDWDRLHAAATSLLSKTPQEIQELSRRAIEGQLRTAIGSTPLEKLLADRAAVSQQAREAAEADLAKIGMTVVSLRLENVRAG